MKLISSITAYYPSFPLSCEPQAIECQLCIVEAEGRRYLKTPNALLDAIGDDDHKRQLGRGYYATAEECEAYLNRTYPNWKAAEPIMAALWDSRRWHGNLVGDGKLADKLEVTRDELFALARGHVSQSPKKIKAALGRLNGKAVA